MYYYQLYVVGSLNLTKYSTSFTDFTCSDALIHGVNIGLRLLS